MWYKEWVLMINFIFSFEGDVFPSEHKTYQWHFLAEQPKAQWSLCRWSKHPELKTFSTFFRTKSSNQLPIHFRSSCNWHFLCKLNFNHLAQRLVKTSCKCRSYLYNPIFYDICSENVDSLKSTDCRTNSKTFFSISTKM